MLLSLLTAVIDPSLYANVFVFRGFLILEGPGTAGAPDVSVG